MIKIPRKLLFPLGLIFLGLCIIAFSNSSHAAKEAGYGHDYRTFHQN